MKKEAYLFIIIFSIVIICFSYNYLLSIITGLNMPGDVASFGSQFGFLNALFSGLAFAVLISTLIQQKVSIKSQQSAIEQTQNILKKQAKLQLNQLEQQKQHNKDEEIRCIYDQIQQFENSLKKITIRFKKLDNKTNEVINWETKNGELVAQEICNLAGKEIEKLINAAANDDRDTLLIRGYFSNFLSYLDKYRHKTKELSHIFKRIDSVPDLSEEYKNELFSYAIDILPECEYNIFNLQYQRSGYRECLPKYVKEQFGRNEAYNHLKDALHTSYEEIAQMVFLSLAYEKWQNFNEEQRNDIRLRTRGVAIFRKGAKERWEKILASLS